MSGEFYFDFSSNKTTHPFLKKGSGKKMSNAKEEKEKFLKKGQGTLASDYHGVTKFSRQRSEAIIDSQCEREIQHYKNNEIMRKYMEKLKSKN